MKLITLNTWGGRIHSPLLKFFEENKDVDVFCLQEIYHNSKTALIGSELHKDAFNLFNEIKEKLSHHYGYFRPSVGETYGLSIFVKKDIQVEEEGDIQIYDVPNYVSGGNHPRNLQWINIKKNDFALTVVNVHGLWNGNGKTDTEDRLIQSENIIRFIKTLNNPFILCGDFNLLPDTESLRKFEQFGLLNLVKENNITSTRTSLYKKEHRFADYVFVSKGIEIKEFKVLPDEVSDHSALLLDFE
ncbi:MAG: endonuclease/exonuclease/phosphatase family protein [Parcubacteria group bacterium]